VRVEVGFDARLSLGLDSRLDAVRRTLQSLFGAGAALEVAQSGTRARIAVSWPRNEPKGSP
jgi:hypothetical protein